MVSDCPAANSIPITEVGSFHLHLRGLQNPISEPIWCYSSQTNQFKCQGLQHWMRLKSHLFGSIEHFDPGANNNENGLSH